MEVKDDGAFGHLEIAPPNAIFETKRRFKVDQDPNKMNLGIGAYRTDEGLPYVLDAVREAERRVVAKEMDKEYLPISGLRPFVEASQKLILGEDSPAILENRVAGVQGISGTGSLRVLFEFISKHLDTSVVYISNPTWGNHPTLIRESGLQSQKYRYWDESTRGLDIDGMLEDLATAPKGSVVLLHACAHNPTGVDPSQEQWNQIADVMQENGLIPLFDSAYQGFATGDLEADAYAVRLFVERGFNLMIAQSFAKNMGLYNMRVGCVSVVTSSERSAKAALSQLCLVIRPMYSNPPVDGARIVIEILNDAELYEAWREELKSMSFRIQDMRKLLFDELSELNTPSPSGDWSHIINQIGMFSFTGLTPDQVDDITDNHHVYMLRNGRISMAGVTSKSASYLAQSIHAVIVNPNSKL